MRLRSWLSAVFVAGAVLVPLHAADWTAEVLYKTPDRTTAYFVPRSVIERGLAEAPMAPADRAYLEHRIESAGDGGRCSEWKLAHQATVRGEDRRSLARIMAESKRLFVGEVQEVVTGWSTSHNNAVTVVWVSPVSILQDAGGALTDGAYAFVIARAELQIDGKRFCNSSNSYEIPRKGDRLLVSAGETIGDGRLFAGAHYFPMTDDQIQPMPFNDVVPFKIMKLDSARAAAAQYTQAVRQ